MPENPTAKTLLEHARAAQLAQQQLRASMRAVAAEVAVVPPPETPARPAS